VEDTWATQGYYLIDNTRATVHEASEDDKG
jgi:hypothetical protein